MPSPDESDSSKPVNNESSPDENESSPKEDGSSPREDENETANPEKSETPPEHPDEDLSKDEQSSLLPPFALKLNSHDTSFSAQCCGGGNQLACLQGDSFPHLFASARAGFGFRSGRYYQELKFVDQPKSVRVGFSIINQGLRHNHLVKRAMVFSLSILDLNVRRLTFNLRLSRGA